MNKIKYQDILENLEDDYLILNKLEEQNIKEYTDIVKLSIHSQIVHSDIHTLVDNYKSSEYLLEKKFYSRIACIIVHEYFLVINNIFGNKFINELEDNDLTKYIEESKNLNTEFQNFKNENKILFKHIRNNFGAHKTKNTSFLITGIFMIDDNRIMNLVEELFNLNEKLLNLVTKVYTEMRYSKQWRILIERIQKNNLAIKTAYNKV